ncbi:hypothetical protein NW752_011141 [Fusarium irregulare]|uniref:Extracellular membrane protein CFEM domain-containing protein n=1 Tax=Fusarium irregulare TaxID=2494466 RepID=A0A9W8PFQ1_9HYPO|nr:hypothetical protein NW766_012170 [Fusarium irregulare]KAJ4005812.1 hypothetical protein NW752_011141 [Fusarium irregulare]
MIFTNLAAGFIAALSISGAAAGPCRLSSSTTATVTIPAASDTTTAETSFVTSVTLTTSGIDFTTDATTVDITATSLVSESTTTALVGEVTTSAAAQPGTSCSTSAECTLYTSYCLDGLLNICVCIDAVCIPVG